MFAGANQTAVRQTVKALLQGAVLGALIGGAFLAGYFFRGRALPAPSTVDFTLLEEADSLLERYFLYELPAEEQRVHGAVGGLAAAAGDPYTYFVEPQTAEVDEGNLAGRFGGIGAELAQNEAGQFVITRVYPGNAAARAGLQDGDVLLSVDGVAVEAIGSALSDIVAAVRGEVDTTVLLEVEREGRVFEFAVVRAEVLVPSTHWRILADDPRIGYIQVTRFTDRAAEEVRTALAELREQGATAFVLDLRNNGGGLVDTAVDVAGEFLDGGVVLYETRRGQPEDTYRARAGGAATDAPLVVLVNEASASASEIVAGALQDRGRAQLVGAQTFGKGSVQRILPMSDGSSLHVTVAEWYTPDRHRIQDAGLTPDIVVESDTDAEDAALAAAADLVGEQLAAVGD